MNIKPININTERPDVLRTKQFFGLWYGMVVGFGFSVFAWGIDGYLLNEFHGLHPWIKFIVGGILCSGIGGVTGWLTARVNKSFYALFFWLTAAYLFARLTVNVPLKFAPAVMSIIEPGTRGLLHYTYYEEMGTRALVAFTWIGIIIAIVGLLQIPMSDSAVFSNSAFGKIMPMLVSVVLMGICGTIVDNGLINEPLRSAVEATDHTIQYVVDQRGKEVNLAEARQMHTGAFRSTQDLVTAERKMVVSSYDSSLGEVRILIQFKGSWVECQVFYNQLSSCKVVEATP